MFIEPCVLQMTKLRRSDMFISPLTGLTKDLFLVKSYKHLVPNGTKK